MSGAARAMRQPDSRLSCALTARRHGAKAVPNASQKQIGTPAYFTVVKRERGVWSSGRKAEAAAGEMGQVARACSPPPPRVAACRA